MQKVTIEIETVNDAFVDVEAHAIAKILREVVQKLEIGGYELYNFNSPSFVHSTLLHDFNGNTVGKITFE